MMKRVDEKNDVIVTLNLLIKIMSWLMLPIAFITVIMTFLSTFNIYVTALFETSRTLITVLFITFLFWTLRSIIDSVKYPTYRVYSVVFAVLTVIAGYLLRANVF